MSTTSDTPGSRAVVDVRVATPHDASAILSFATQRPLSWNDFASIATLQPDEPRVWIALDRDHTVVAAAIDDGLAMSVGGASEGLLAIAEAVDDVPGKLVIAGRTAEVRTFVSRVAPTRRERPEHFMAIRSADLRASVEPIPMRVAGEQDLPLLIRVRAAALEEEYGIPVEAGSVLHTELSNAVRRAVGLQGVAIWTEGDRCAFTAQLIAKTPDASMFGDLYVDKDLRGAGRATRALTAFCSWLMTESEHVTLRVGTQNVPALRLYERVGFSVVDEFCSSLARNSPGG